jgi:two-component system, OmpR family, KDP operon response regulator KdpE
MATVLVCDGNPVERRILRMTLDMDGHRIAEASSSKEALDVLSKWTFDLVLLAMELPDGSGYGVIEETRLMPGRENIRIVAILEQDDAKGPVESFLAGAVDVLIRPYGAQDLRDIVMRATSAEIDLRDTPQREAYLEALRLQGQARSE